MATIRFKRGTRAQITSAASADGLIDGEPYLMTDGGLAIGRGTDSFQEYGPLDVAVSNKGSTSSVIIDRRVALYNIWSPDTTADANANIPLEGFPVGAMGEIQLRAVNLGAVISAGFAVTFPTVEFWIGEDGKIYATPELAGISWTVNGSDMIKFWSENQSSGIFAQVSKGVKTFSRMAKGAVRSDEDQHPAVIPGPGLLDLSVRTEHSQLVLTTVNESGRVFIPQETLMGNNLFTWMPTPAATTIAIAGGAAALSALGTATASTPANTNLQTLTKRVDYLVTTAATTAIAGVHLGNAYWTIGEAVKAVYGSTTSTVYPAIGGFTFFCKFFISTGAATTTSRCFVGMRGAGTPTDAQPSSIANSIGFGWDSADTNIQFMRNDGSGTATKIDLGSSFPVPTVDKDTIYEATLSFSPGVGKNLAPTLRSYSLVAKPSTTWGILAGNQSAVPFDLPMRKASGVIPNSKLPAVTTLLKPAAWVSVGGTSAIIGLGFMGMSIKSDY